MLLSGRQQSRGGPSSASCRPREAPRGRPESPEFCRRKSRVRATRRSPRKTGDRRTGPRPLCSESLQMTRIAVSALHSPRMPPPPLAPAQAAGPRRARSRALRLAGAGHRPRRPRRRRLGRRRPAARRTAGRSRGAGDRRPRLAGARAGGERGRVGRGGRARRPGARARAAPAGACTPSCCALPRGEELGVVAWLEEPLDRDGAMGGDGSAVERAADASGRGDGAARPPGLGGRLRPISIGDDPQVVATKAAAERFARTRLPILLLAETGTGKDLLARAIHGASPRRERPFVAINCGALSPHLLESELFGYAPGSVHRRAPRGPRRQGRRRPRRHALPRRSRRDARPPAGAAAARARGRHLLPGRRERAAAGRRAPDLRHLPRPARHGRGRLVPPRPLLPHRRRRALAAAGARALRRGEPGAPRLRRDSPRARCPARRRPACRAARSSTSPRRAGRATCARSAPRCSTRWRSPTASEIRPEHLPKLDLGRASAARRGRDRAPTRRSGRRERRSPRPTGASASPSSSTSW